LRLSLGSGSFIVPNTHSLRVNQSTLRRPQGMGAQTRSWT
jgi:hypothetical protein